MNILHLNTVDHGGAAKAVLRLHDALSARNMNSHVLVFEAKGKHHNVHALHTDSVIYRIRRRIGKLGEVLKRSENLDGDYYYQDSVQSPIRDIKELERSIPVNPDILMVHWIARYLTPDLIAGLSRKYHAPVVWYLLDMAPLTGGCHYAWDCLGYERQCGNCPALNSKDEHDRSHQAWSSKEQGFRGLDLTIVAATQRLADQAARSSLFRNIRREKIMIGVDPLVFNNGSIAEARTRLSLPLDKQIILFGATSLSEKRKGYAYLLEALRSLMRKDSVDRETLFAVTIGNAGNERSELEKLLPCRHIEYVQSDAALADVYRAADVFVCPSIEDSGPMMINESLMCGTPVIAFDMGVAQDLVHSGQTGYRARLKDHEDLASGISEVLQLPVDRKIRMRQQCRDTALRLCHPDVQATSFIRLFEALQANRTLTTAT